MKAINPWDSPLMISSSEVITRLKFTLQQCFHCLLGVVVQAFAFFLGPVTRLTTPPIKLPKPELHHALKQKKKNSICLPCGICSFLGNLHPLRESMGTWSSALYCKEIYGKEMWISVLLHRFREKSQWYYAKEEYLLGQAKDHAFVLELIKLKSISVWFPPYL